MIDEPSHTPGPPQRIPNTLDLPDWRAIIKLHCSVKEQKTVAFSLSLYS